MEGGGQMPRELQGVFSGLTSCQRAFDNYIARMQQDEKPKRTPRKKKVELSEESDV